jgi:hypothetical protein
MSRERRDRFPQIPSIPEEWTKKEVSDSSAKNNCVLTLSRDDRISNIPYVVQALTASMRRYAPNGGE